MPLEPSHRRVRYLLPGLGEERRWRTKPRHGGLAGAGGTDGPRAPEATVVEEQLRADDTPQREDCAWAELRCLGLSPGSHQTFRSRIEHSCQAQVC